MTHAISQHAIGVAALSAVCLIITALGIVVLVAALKDKP